MQMKQAMNRIKVLANLVRTGGVEVKVSTFEDGMADTREEGESPFVAEIVERDGHRYMSETGTDPWECLDALLKRLEVVAVAHLHVERQDHGKKAKKLSETIRAIENGQPLP